MILKFILLASIVATSLAKEKEEPLKLSEEITEALHKYLAQSWHISQSNETDLNLTSYDLKLYTSFVLNMFKSKCPAVNGERLIKINRFIGKVLGVGMEQITNITEWHNPKIDTLFESLQTCSKTVEQPSPPVKLSHIEAKHFVISHPNGKLVIYEGDLLNPIVKPTDNKDSAGATPSDPQANVNKTATPADSVTLHFPKDASMKKGWIASVFEQIYSFFTETIPSTFSGEKYAGKVSKSRKPWEISYKKSGNLIREFLGHMCRVFCSKCQAHALAKNIRMASRELMDFLLKNEHLARALASLLDDEFLDSMAQCDERITYVSMNALTAYTKQRKSEQQATGHVKKVE